MLLGAVITGLIMYYPRSQQAIAPPVEAQALSNLEDDFVAVASRVKPAVVTITAESVIERNVPSLDLRDFFDNPWFELPPWFGGPEERKPGDQPRKWKQRTSVLGSGWIYRSDGYIVTNSHVVAGAKNIKVRLHDVENDVKEYPARVVGDDPSTELAVIKIDAPRKLPTLPLGDSEALRVGQWVLAIGAPFHYEQTVTAGIVSAKGRLLHPPDKRYSQLGDIIQTDASINPGNSGGPLVNLRGEVVGINVAIYGAAIGANIGIGFAIPAETAKWVVPQLIKNKQVVRGWLGISITDVDEDKRQFYGVPDGGALVENIQPDGPAAKSQLQEEDVIVAVNGQPVRDAYDLQKMIAQSRPGSTVTLDVYRNRRPTKVRVRLGEMPAEYTGVKQPEEQPTERAQEPETPETATALGITVSNIPPSIARQLKLENNQGVFVERVAPDSPAAGILERGVIILRVNWDVVNSASDFKKAMNKAQKSGQDFIMLRVKVNIDGEWMNRSLSIPL